VLITRYADRRLHLAGYGYIKFSDIIKFIKDGETNIRIKQFGKGDCDITEQIIFDAATKHLDINLDDVLNLVMNSKIKQ